MLWTLDQKQIELAPHSAINHLKIMRKLEDILAEDEKVPISSFYSQVLQGCWLLMKFMNTELVEESNHGQFSLSKLEYVFPTKQKK